MLLCRSEQGPREQDMQVQVQDMQVPPARGESSDIIDADPPVAESMAIVDPFDARHNMKEDEVHGWPKQPSKRSWLRDVACPALTSTCHVACFVLATTC